MTTETQDLWAFSLALYANPGVAEALLALQRAHHADVNLLLYAAWHAASGRGAVSRARWAELERGLAAWRHHVILPLREVRERIKQQTELARLEGAAEVREQVLAAELGAERVGQWWLQADTPAPPAAAAAPADGGAADCAAALDAYFALRQVSRAAHGQARWQPLLDALRHGNN